MTYAENMPDWVVSKYFDPEAERHRLLVHDYQQTEIQQMRSMKKTKRVDSIELPLISLDDVLTAVNKVLSSGLNKYLSQFITPFIGDWPMQFFIRQLVYSNAPTCSTCNPEECNTLDWSITHFIECQRVCIVTIP